MEVFIYFTLVVSAILVTNMSSGSYLTLEVSSNPILSGLTRTLTMSCYIRDDSFSAAPGSAKDIDTPNSTPTSVKTAPSQSTALPTVNAETTQAAINSPTTNTVPNQKPLLHVTSSPAEVFHLMSIVIINTRSPGEGETIAEVTPYNPPAAEGTYVGKVQVNGSVLQTQANGEFGFLSLIWTAPLDDLVGTYTCEANALTHSGRLVTLTGSLGIQARQPEVEDLVPFIIGFDNRIAQLEQENQELKHRLDLLKV